MAHLTPAQPHGGAYLAAAVLATGSPRDLHRPAVALHQVASQGQLSGTEARHASGSFRVSAHLAEQNCPLDNPELINAPTEPIQHRNTSACLLQLGPFAIMAPS